MTHKRLWQYSPSIFLAPNVEFAVERIVVWNLDRITLGMKIVKLNVATFQPLAQISGHLRRVSCIMIDKFTPNGGDYHHMRMRLKVVGVDGD